MSRYQLQQRQAVLAVQMDNERRMTAGPESNGSHDKYSNSDAYCLNEYVTGSHVLKQQKNATLNIHMKDRSRAEIDMMLARDFPASASLRS